jgi:AraC family transcriptional regulator, exoenzyme S synthesis regulatory protein ExsA
MINVYDDISNNSLFRKIKVDEQLFVEYTCHVVEGRAEIWSHNNFFAYVLGGKKMYKTLKGEYTLRAGEALFFKKGASTIYQYFEETFCVILIFLTDDFIKNVIKKYGLKFPDKKTIATSDAIIPIKVDPVLDAYFKSIMPYFAEKQTPPKDLIKIKLEEILLIIFSNMAHSSLIMHFQELCTNSKLNIKEVMEANFHRNLTLSQFARICAQSLSSFKRNFIDVFGMPPGKWLTDKRLDYSRYLLKNTCLSIDEIIIESGFTNMSHFIRIFKDKHGLTPYQFRKANRSIR